MKKIFTLISMAFVAMSVNAQTAEEWTTAKLTFSNETIGGKETPVLQDAVESDNKSASYLIPAEAKQFPEGTYPDKVSDVTDWLKNQTDPSMYAIALKEYTFTATTESVTLKAVSTPNSDAAKNEAWQLSTQANEGLTTDDCSFKITNYVKPKNGDPSLAYYDFYDTNSDGDATHRVSNVFWTPGCGSLPGKGCYYEVTATKAGKLKMAICMWKNLPQRPLYIIDESTEANGYTVLPASNIKIEGFLQNNGWDGWHSKVWHTFTLGESDFLLYEDGELPPNSRTFYGYITFDIEAGKTYMVMNPNNQMGLYGFQFSTTSGISNVKAEQNADGAIYNLAGQKVDKSFKGIVLKNGKKVVIK